MFFLSVTLYPKTPWDVMGCQNHLFGGPFRGVTRRVWCFHSFGVGSLRVNHFLVFVHRFCLRIITKKTHDSNIGNLSFSTARSLCNGDERWWDQGGPTVLRVYILDHHNYRIFRRGGLYRNLHLPLLRGEGHTRDILPRDPITF